MLFMSYGWVIGNEFCHVNLFVFEFLSLFNLVKVNFYNGLKIIVQQV